MVPDVPIKAKLEDLFDALGGLVLDALGQATFISNRERVGSHKAFREPDDANLCAAGNLYLCGRATRELDTASSDIDDHRRPGRDIYPVDRRPVDQAGLNRSRDHADPDTGALAHGRQEFSAVFRFPDRAGRRRHDFVHIVRLGEPAEF